MTTDPLMAAYRATGFRVADPPYAFVLRVGQISDDLQDIFSTHGVRSAAFLTAYNPRSAPTASHLNEKAQAQLLSLLSASGVPFLSGAGESDDGLWPAEPSVLALGLTRQEAETLGLLFEQNAIVWCDADAVPILVDLTEL